MLEVISSFAAPTVFKEMSAPLKEIKSSQLIF